MFQEFKIKTAEQAIEKFIQQDYISLWMAYESDDENKQSDDGVYFNPDGFPDMGPGLHMIKKSIPTKVQSLSEFLQSASLNCESIKETKVEKVSNFDINVIGNYALVLFDLAVRIMLENSKIITMETIVAQTLLLTNKGWRIINEDVSN